MYHFYLGSGLLIFLMLQIGVASNITLLSGTADLILLFLAAWGLQGKSKSIWLWSIIAGVICGLISAMPFYLPLISYLAITGLTQLIRRRVWQTPILVMFLVTFIGTLFQHTIYVFGLRITGEIFSLTNAFNNIAVPSLIINMMVAVPMYAIIQEVALRMNTTGQEI
jgi:cell shape-determining protein MreD